MHGHTYRVRVHIEGPVDAENGWVMDFADMKRACAPLIEQLDHHHLNEIPGLENPTAEALARWFWERLKDALPLKQIVVQETASSGCIYRGEEKGP
jgi:6-pyruvoyltetrahydropterin/6-carboxytetrahydropterin synthase